MKMSEAFPSEFLKCQDLQGREVTVTMAAVQDEMIGMDKEQKHVLSFVNCKKRFIVNKTNWGEIEALYGDSDLWSGKQIVLYPTKTQFGNKLVDCIRVRAPKPPAIAAPAAAVPPADVPPADVANAEFQQAANSDPPSDDIPF
jgi:hypothetical protein